jgi:transposase
MVELVRAGRSPEELAGEFEPTAQSIRNWVVQSQRDAGRGDGGLTTAEREELNRLRRENRQLRLERDILSKAAAWFARETNNNNRIKSQHCGTHTDSVMQTDRPPCRFALCRKELAEPRTLEMLKPADEGGP